MIDQGLIESNISTLRDSLNNRKGTGLDYVYSLNNVFSIDMIEKIRKEFKFNTEWNTVHLQEKFPRKAIPWKPESVVEEVYSVFRALEQEISVIFSTQLKFQSVNFWQDSPGYTIDPHLDNNRISVAVQVYINEADPLLGTEMYKDGNVFYKLPWISNTGYILNNTPDSIHGMQTAGTTSRQHVYAIYK